MRLATYNVQNLFDRSVAMNQATWAAGKDYLAAYSKFNSLAQESMYDAAKKTKLLGYLTDLEILYENKHGVLRLASNPHYAELRENKGDFLKQPTDPTQPVQIVASGRGDWTGWVDLKKEPVDETNSKNTGQVIADINPDVIGIVEAEGRPTLERFDRTIIPNGPAYAHHMLIEGNDQRGIDVGIMAKKGYEIVSIKSHVDDLDSTGGYLFGRDSTEYEIQTPTNQRLVVIIAHLKSKGYRGSRNPDDLRKEQATRIRDIYNGLLANFGNVAVIGDFNDHPNNGPLDPLLKGGNPPVDVSQHASYQNDGIPGTFGPGYAANKFDYILLSPALYGQVTAAGVYRKGVWDNRKTPKWPMYPNMTKPVHGASDHALMWVDINI